MQNGFYCGHSVNYVFEAKVLDANILAGELDT